jgi:phosphatidylinositol dimannoside acyltransferase
MRLLFDGFRWIFFFPFRRIIQCLPRTCVYAVGKLGGSILFTIKKRRRFIAMEEIHRLLGSESPSERERVEIVKRGFQLSFTTLLETFCFPRLSPENIDQWIQLKGKNHLDEALENNRGVLIILIHFGANQMIMPALGHRNYSINQLGSRPEDWNRLSGIRPSFIERKIFMLQMDLESSLPAHFIYLDKSMKPVYDCLKTKNILIMAADGRAGSRFLQASVLDRIMNLSSGPFRIAYKMGSPILPMFPVRQKEGHIVLEIEKPLEVMVTFSANGWAETAASKFGERISRRLKKHPDHYCMLMAEAHNRAELDSTPLFEDYRDNGNG